MPKILKLQDQELVMLKQIRDDTLRTSQLSNVGQVSQKIIDIDGQIKAHNAQSTSSLDKLNQEKNNLLKLQELEEAIKLLEGKKSPKKSNEFFSILDHQKGYIKSVSFTVPGLPAHKIERSALFSDDSLKGVMNSDYKPQILRIENPSKCDITVEFSDGGSFTKHSNGDISLKMSEKNPAQKKDQGLYAFTREILLEYKKQEKAANGSKKIPIAINFEGIPDSYKDEWKKETLKNIIYNYTLDGDFHGRQDRFNQIMSALIAGGSMTLTDKNRYGIEMSEATADKTRFTFYSALSTQQTVDDLKLDFVSKDQKVDSEISEVFKKGGAKAVNSTLGLLKGAVNTGLRAIGGHNQISQSTGMINRKDNKTLILEDLQRLYNELTTSKSFPKDLKEFKDKVKSNSAYTRLIDKYMTSEQIYELLDSKNKFVKLKNIPSQDLDANPDFKELVEKGFDKQKLEEVLKSLRSSTPSRP